MSIQDFHAKLVDGNESNRLLVALRQLMKLQDLTSMNDSGWEVWTNEAGDPPPALAVAKT